MQSTRATITLSDDGFVLRKTGDSQSVEWVHVAEVVAYRRDPAGEDLLCLAFRASREGRYIEINEEMAGYEALLESMYEAFPEINRTWWQDVAAGLGSNRVTLYGLPAAEMDEPSPAERYLQQIHQRKHLSRSDWTKVGWSCAGVWAVAGAQTFFVWLLGGWNVLVGFAVLPLILTVIVARFVQRPRTFFLLLIGFYLAEGFWTVVLSRWPVCLLGKLFEGRLSYLLLLGVEILLAMGVMLLPNRRAAGTRLR